MLSIWTGRHCCPQNTLGQYSPNILKNVTKYSQEHSVSFPQDFVILIVRQLLIGQTVWFSQSEVVLHSNVSKYRKIWRTRLRTFLTHSHTMTPFDVSE